MEAWLQQQKQQLQQEEEEQQKLALQRFTDKTTGAPRSSGMSLQDFLAKKEESLKKREDGFTCCGCEEPWSWNERYECIFPSKDNPSVPCAHPMCAQCYEMLSHKCGCEWNHYKLDEMDASPPQCGNALEDQFYKCKLCHYVNDTNSDLEWAQLSPRDHKRSAQQ